MPVFEYTAINARGKTISGIIDADSENAAREKLRATAVYPVTIQEAYDTAPKKEGGRFQRIRLFSRVHPNELTITTRQLATLVGSGFPLASAIYSLIPQTGSPALKKILSRVKDAIEEGNSFAEALANFPDVFSPIYINMVRAGEASGTLEVVLERLAEINENRQVQKNRIISILAYPAVMMVLGCGILAFLLIGIVPRFVSIFEDMNQVLPLPTRIIIGFSDLLAGYWWLLAGLLIGLYLVLQAVIKTEKGRYQTDKLILLSPGISTLAIEVARARFARILGSLLENGLPLLTALHLVKNIVGNKLIAEAIADTAGKVEKGMGLGAGLEEAGIFPMLPVQMIKVGEQSGDLEKMLLKTAEVFENEVETTLVSLTSLLQPLLVVFMGLIILFIVLSIILPIFQMNQLVG